jgi:hypothetical protein
MELYSATDEDRRRCDVKRVFIAMAAGLVATSVVSGQAPNWSQKAGWSSRSDIKMQIPFKVFDNIYYVGTITSAPI